MILVIVLASSPRVVLPRVLFRGLAVTLGPGRSGSYHDDLRDPSLRNALAEAMQSSEGAGDTPGRTDDEAAAAPFFLPELVVGDHATAAYGAHKCDQLTRAAELWRLKRRIRALEAAHSGLIAEEGRARVAALHDAGRHGAESLRCWELCENLGPTDVPPRWEMDAALRDVGMRAALEAPPRCQEVWAPAAPTVVGW